jgi:hypothetical protein
MIRSTRTGNSAVPLPQPIARVPSLHPRSVESQHLDGNRTVWRINTSTGISSLGRNDRVRPNDRDALRL